MNIQTAYCYRVIIIIFIFVGTWSCYNNKENKIIKAEIIYDRSLFKALFNQLKFNLHPAHIEILIYTEQRVEFSNDRVLEKNVIFCLYAGGSVCATQFFVILMCHSAPHH
jgi:hypothetical protein